MPADPETGAALPPIAPVDEMEGHFLDANERMAEALVAIGMALGLPRPSVDATWGAPEILGRIAEVHALLDLWGTDRRLDAAGRRGVRRAWPEMGQRLDDLMETRDASAASVAASGDTATTQTAVGAVSPTVRRAAAAELAFPIRERAATTVDATTARDAGEYLHAVLESGRDPAQALDMVRYVFGFDPSPGDLPETPEDA